MTENNIVEMSDIIDLLVTKRKFTSAEFAKISKQLNELENEKKTNASNLIFINQLVNWKCLIKNLHKFISIQLRLSRK